jgi:hypothetical protein
MRQALARLHMQHELLKGFPHEAILDELLRLDLAAG